MFVWGFGGCVTALLDCVGASVALFRFVPCSLVAPMMGNVGSSLVSVAAVGSGEDMRASIEEDARMSDIRFGGIVGVASVASVQSSCLD